MIHFYTTCLVLASLLATASLWRLWVIDLREKLLPNTYVLTFLICGISTQLSLQHLFWPQALGFFDMGLGALYGGGILLIIRTIANWWYRFDTLGLGDVKLMTAAGIWLGPYFVLLALCTGAAFGMLHGLIISKTSKSKTPLSQTNVPAGPGFILGICSAGALMILEPWLITLS